MIKIQMPVPVAWRTRYPAEPGMVGQYPWHYTDYEPKRLVFAPEKESLITTTQAEAYANDRVKQALEEAFIEVMRCKTSGIIRNGTVDKCADAIRALMPKEPPCDTC